MVIPKKLFNPNVPPMSIVSINGNPAHGGVRWKQSFDGSRIRVLNHARKLDGPSIQRTIIPRLEGK
jgi:hypothetical protein